MSEFYAYLDQAIYQVSKEYEINNLYTIQNVYSERDYWPRLANLTFHDKLFNGHGYHILYEVQGLSSQIHFGLASCFLFKNKISTVTGQPNIYNHRYTFMLESTIHGIYGYWNRVGLVLNTYLRNPIRINNTYFTTVVAQLLLDYPELEQNKYYQWLAAVDASIKELNRNEFAHHNSLIMQNFLPKDGKRDDFEKLLAMPELLLSHNKAIVDEIYNLVELCEHLEGIAEH